VKGFRDEYLPQPLRSGFTAIFGRDGILGLGVGHPYQIVLVRSGSLGGITALARILRRGVPVLGLPYRKGGIATVGPRLQLMGVIPTAAALQHPPASLGKAYKSITASHSALRSQMEFYRTGPNGVILWMDGDVILQMQRRAKLTEANRKVGKERKKMRSIREATRARARARGRKR
jgi:hypothetical protein